MIGHWQQCPIFYWVNIMGKKTYVNAVTERLLDTDNYRSVNDYAQQRFISAQRNNIRPSMRNKSFTEFLLTSHQNSMVTKFRQVYKFAKDKSRYMYGLPTSAIGTDADFDLEVTYEDYLNDIEGGDVTILKDRISPKNLQFFAWVELYEKYQYSGVDNTIGYLNVKHGTPCYLESAILVMSESTITDAQIDNNIDAGGLAFNYGECFDRVRDYNRVQEQPPIKGNKDSLILSYAYKQNATIKYGSMTIDLSHVNPEVVEEVDENIKPTSPEGLWGIVKDEYNKVEEPEELNWIQVTYLKGNEVKLFKYAHLSGGIPRLDNAITTIEDVGQYFPRIYLREDAVNTVKRKSDDERKIHTEKILRKLDLNLGETTDMVMDAIGKVNKEYKHVFIHLTVSVNKDMEDIATARYLYTYMDRLYKLSKDDPNNAIGLPNSRGSMHQTVKDISYTQSIGYSGIAKEVVTGVLTNKAGKKLAVGDYITKTNGSIDSSGSGWFRNSVRYVHTFNYQISSTQYLRISVLDLRMKHHISGKTITEQNDSDQLTLPLDKAILDTLSFVEQDRLLNRALQLTVLTKKVVKERWYETGIFKVVVAIVSIAINVVVPGGGLSLMALLEAIAIAVITSLAINAAIGVLIDLAISLGLSPELVAIVTAVAVMAAAGYGAGKIDFTKAFNAKNMLLALNKSLEAYQKGIANKIADIQKEIKDFTEYAKERNEVLKTAQEMLNTGVIPANLEILTTGVIGHNYLYLGETPEEFYTRTTVTDVTDIDMYMAEYFHDMTTSLPKPGMSYVRETEDVADVLLIK